MNAAELPPSGNTANDVAPPISALRRDTPARSKDVRRSGARILDIAEGILIALRSYNPNQAFMEIARTAKSHSVGALSLADALVAIASQDHQSISDGDEATLAAARDTWGYLFDVVRPYNAVRPGRERCDKSNFFEDIDTKG
ncbi:hypothetical protein ACOJVU_12855 [Mycobacterium sp. THU-M104]|uniref:hypothetical protein n=1 Tax=Mycobacterium sp. THU-M104 TaxID=3410515 RepID=UPI003B9AD04E